MSLKKRGICGLCSAGCWIIAEYDDHGKIVKVSPEKKTPMGYICRIGEHSPDIVYSPDRLLYPMKRKGSRENYDFEKISWHTAYEIIAEKLISIKKKYGPEACAVYTGTGTFEQSFCDVFQPADVEISSASSVLFPFGSPNTMGVGALCYVSYGMIAPHVTTGKMLKDMFNDIDNSELIVVWGTNPATDMPPVEMKRIIEASDRGADVVVIDPRKTETVKLTDGQWIPIRPGTDGAFALGLCNILIEEELFDQEFAGKWTIGFDEFSGYVQHFTPEKVEIITGVKAEILKEFALKLSSARGASQLMYTGMEYSNSGVQAIRASLVLWALAGQLDVPGGRCFSMNKNFFPVNRDGLIPNPDKGIRIGKDRFPLYIKYRDEAHAIGLPDSVLKGKPYKIRALIIQGASLTTSWPNTELWKKTLNSLEFLVCIDRQLSADSLYADLILPACTYFEIDSYMVYGSLFRIREKMIEPLGQSRSDFSIMADLASKLGYGHLYPQSSEELYNYVLKDSGFSYDEIKKAGGTVSVQTEIMQYKKWEKGLLRKDGKPGFDTPSGKFEIHSSILEDYGYDPLPVYTEPVEGPMTSPEYENFPLVFNSGSRTRTSFHTQHRGIKNLNSETPEPLILMNQKDADDRSISESDIVTVSTPRGSLNVRAILTDDIVQGAVDINHAGGSPKARGKWKDYYINTLTDMDNYDPISGFPVYKCLLCNVEKNIYQEKNKTSYAGKRDLSREELILSKSDRTYKKIYFDNNATTPLAAEVKEAMLQSIDIFGNPSSIHSSGRASKKIIDNSRRSIGAALGCRPARIVFTGGGSEANNLAIKGVAFANYKYKNHIITSSVEHPAVLKTCAWLEKFGIRVTYVPVHTNGVINMDILKKSITEKTCLITIMTANNETGTIQPVKEISEIASGHGIVFHSDGVQAVGKIPVDVEKMGVDLYTLSSHKLYGPKGTGALYIKKGTRIDSLIHGGGHEHGLRAGTENITGIAGFGKAAELIPEHLSLMKTVEQCRDRLQQEIISCADEYKINGDLIKRLPNTLNISLKGYRGESIVLELDRKGICISSGSACKSGSSDPSHALLAMGMSLEQAHAALRISLGVTNTLDDVSFFVKQLKTVINDSKSVVTFLPCR